MMQSNESIEDFYAYLFAIRVALQDTYENELDIIRELKNYLLDINESPDTINQTLHNFYQHFGIDIQLHTIEQISILNNMVSFMLNSNNYELQEQSEDNESSPELAFNSQPNGQNDTSSNVYSHNNMVNLINTIINELGYEIIASEHTANSFQDVIVTVDDSDLEKLESTKLESKLDTDCCICMGHMDKDDMSTELKCYHIFHTDCIKPYLQQYNYKCPICRTEVGKAKYNM